MSVLLKNRNESEAQFINTARELEAKTRRRCVNAPKRYTFYGLQELWATARRIHSYTKQANSVFPTNQREAQIRRDFFIHARTNLQDYVSQLELLLEDNILTPTAGEELARLVAYEDRLVKAVMKSDKARYKDLPQ